MLDPATSVLLAGAAHDARSAQLAREMPESDLTRALRAVFSQPDFRALLAGREGAEELLTELESASHQVFLARKFYNDAVAATLAARQRWLARVLRLAGRAPHPEFFEIDDSLVPAGGGRRRPHRRHPAPDLLARPVRRSVTARRAHGALAAATAIVFCG